MEQKTVLSIGQCRPDQAAITHYLTSGFAARVLTADLQAHVMPILQQNEVHLILINRKLDIDSSDGMDILRSLKAGNSTRKIPVMLVSNFPEWQQKAVDAGALYGFGKAELNSPATKQRLAAVLSRGNEISSEQ